MTYNAMFIHIEMQWTIHFNNWNSQTSKHSCKNDLKMCVYNKWDSNPLKSRDITGQYNASNMQSTGVYRGRFGEFSGARAPLFSVNKMVDISILYGEISTACVAYDRQNFLTITLDIVIQSQTSVTLLHDNTIL